MNKIDDAWAMLKALPPHAQELAADAIMDFASQSDGPQLSDEQAALIEDRMHVSEPKIISSAELRVRLRKLTP